MGPLLEWVPFWIRIRVVTSRPWNRVSNHPRDTPVRDTRHRGVSNGHDGVHLGLRRALHLMRDRKRGNMAQGVSRRRYSKLVGYLTSVMIDPKVAIRVRMSAAVRLDGIYARCEEQSEEALRRKDRLARAALGQAEAVAPVLEKPVGEDEDERVRSVFAGIMGRGSDVHAE